MVRLSGVREDCFTERGCCDTASVSHGEQIRTTRSLHHVSCSENIRLDETSPLHTQPASRRKNKRPRTLTIRRYGIGGLQCSRCSNRRSNRLPTLRQSNPMGRRRRIGGRPAASANLTPDNSETTISSRRRTGWSSRWPVRRLGVSYSHTYITVRMHLVHARGRDYLGSGRRKDEITVRWMDCRRYNKGAEKLAPCKLSQTPSSHFAVFQKKKKTKKNRASELGPCFPILSIGRRRPRSSSLLPPFLGFAARCVHT